MADGRQGKGGPIQRKPIELTNADWGKIHALAWRNDKDRLVKTRNGKELPYREALEQDPTNAILHYLVQEKRLTKDDLSNRDVIVKIVKLRPDPCDVPAEFWDDVNPFPPSCC